MTFKEITDDTSELAAELALQTGADEGELTELLESFTPDFDIELAAAAAHGCVIIRIFDMGRYIFSYPYEMTDEASLTGAIEEVGRYAMREELPLVFSDVPREEIPRILSLGYKHLELDAEDEDSEAFRVRIISECALAEEIPTASDGELSLGALTQEDIPTYAEISREQTALEYWGYDYRADAPDAPDEYFYNIASRDFHAGVSMTLAIRLSGELVGEVEMYAFDCRGGADFALRLLPSARGKGIGKRALSLVFDAARSLGLSKLFCDVMEKNKPSLAFVSSKMQRISSDNSSVRFIKEL